MLFLLFIALIARNKDEKKIKISFCTYKIDTKFESQKEEKSQM